MAKNELSVNCVLVPVNCTVQLHIHDKGVIIITSNIFPGEPETTLHIYVHCSVKVTSDHRTKFTAHIKQMPLCTSFCQQFKTDL
jgi:hypothetical protein